VTTATMDITHMLARLTATTDLTGLPVECLSALAPGMAGGVVGAGVVGVMATMVAAAGATDGVVMAMPVVAMATDGAAMVMVAGSLAGADLQVVRLAVGFMAARWPAAVEVSTVVAVASTAVEEGSTVAVVDTAAAVGTAAADTGNRGGSGVS